MTPRHTVWRAVAAAGAASLALAACGSDTSSTDTGSTPSAAGSSSASASASGSSAPLTTNTGDGVLTIGTLLPQTGNLAFLGPPEFAGVDLAIKEINEAGGVLGKPVEKLRR